MIDENMKVEVESVGIGSVGYQPAHNPLIRRRWDKPGVKKKIAFGEIQEVMSTTGGYNLFLNHLLIKDIEVRKELDLPVDEESMYSDADLGKLLTGTLAKLKEALPNLSPDLQQRIAEKALETKLESVPKLKVIKEITGIDVYAKMQQE